MQRLFSRVAWIIFGAVFIAVLLECVLRFLPVSMGLYRTQQFDKWPLQNSEPKLPYAYSISWAMLNAHRGTTNNYGHIAPFDFTQGSRPVIVVGDSFIESLMNDYGDTLQGQLGQMIKSPRSVYGLGVSGLSASDYVVMSRLARDEFSPAAAVFLMVDGDLSESRGPHPGHHSLVPDGDALKAVYAPLTGESTAKKIRKWVGDISLYRYFQVNLQFSADQIWKPLVREPATNMRGGNPARDAAYQRQVADLLLEQLPAGLGLAPECIVFLMDSDRYAIYKPDQVSTPKDSPEVKRYFMDEAQRRGFKVSDLDPVFRTQFAQDRVKFDYWPVDRHWNKTGHGVGAREAHRLLYTPGQRKACMDGKQAGRGS
jgi:hypothetical protein